MARRPMRHDVLVVGGGPVGAATALALHARGFDVALIERNRAPGAWDAGAYDPRVYAIAPTSQAFLHGLGVWEAIAGARVSAYAQMHIWERGLPPALSFQAADVGRAQLGWIVEHGLIADALWRRLRELPVHTEGAIERAHFRDDGASIFLCDGRELQSRLVVAADGADSQMRRLAGIDTVTWRYGQRAIVCHVATERPHRMRAWQRFLKTGPLALLPLADGRSSIVWSADDALAAEMLALDDAAFCARLSAASEYALGAVLSATPRIAVPLQLLHARDYLAPSLVLVGDAAHAIHPLAGQGVNLGFADAQALASTLSEARTARRDWASRRNLRRYARARKAQNLEMLALTDTLYRLFRPTLPGLRALLGAGMGVVDRSGPIKSLLAQRAASA